MKFQTISFNGQSLTAINQNQTIYVAMKPICENIGLDWEAQRQKIKRNHILNSVAFMLKATAKDGKSYETMCLPLGFLSGWLMSVEVNRVNPEIRDTLIQYQLKCYDVLHQHFMPHQAIYPKTTADDRTGLRQAVAALVGRKGIDYSSAYSMIHQRFNVEAIEDIPAEKLPEAVAYVHALTLHTGLIGEVLDREPLPAPQPALPISSNALYDLAVAVRYGAWAIQMGRDVSLPLKQLGCKQAVTMWTVWSETRSRLKAAANALEALNEHADAEHAEKIRPMLPEIRNLSSV
ncbi:phage antirepressor N-terminal domain-containing protein [Neisseria lactamica]|uniref:phage antirepressor N-terminal domain-containing protein n=1 Tax=Neisseria lactamica TaxID=486 RepID=UPI000E58EE23|nr:phage antirepressor N-terminal domain-containing protein [Neisseria lactamica]